MFGLTTLAITLIWLQHLAILDGHKLDNARLNYFDTDLLRYTTEEKSGNVMVSPASIKSVLAMVLEGASGLTAEEIRSALRLYPSKEEFREQLNMYLSLLRANHTGAFLQITNGVFFSQKLHINKEYEVMLQKVYFAEVCKMDFKDPLYATDFINHWVSNATKGLIPTIVDPVNINPATDILLVNALYFKSNWVFPFNLRATRSGCFYNRKVCRTVAMMELHAELNYTYVDNLRAHAVELPYEGKHYSMILLVPQDREGLATLVRDLPYMSLPHVTSLMEPSDVMLFLPKFSVDFSDDMVAPLRNMRIRTLFSAQANLSGVFEGNMPQINNIYHKVHLTVDEAGTVAAAVTGAVVIPLIENGVQLRVDRPFVFFIRDNNRGSVLFEGVIREPSEFVDSNGLNSASEKLRTTLIPGRRY